jgi:hypothetical protein
VRETSDVSVPGAKRKIEIVFAIRRRVICIGFHLPDLRRMPCGVRCTQQQELIGVPRRCRRSRAGVNAEGAVRR